MTTDEYIKLAEPLIVQELYLSMETLSNILNTTNGKIRDKDASTVSSDLQLTSSNQIIGDHSPIVLDNDSLLGQESFAPVLSRYGMEILSGLNLMKDTYVDKPLYSVSTNTSILLEHSRNLPDSVSTYSSYLIVESYAILRTLVEYKAGMVFKMDVSEIDTIMQNSRYISAIVGKTGNSEDTYMFLNVLKYLQRHILFIKRCITTIVR